MKYLFAFPSLGRGVYSMWLRNYLYFKKTWFVSFFWIVLEPLIYLGAIGYGLGAFVNNMGGISYVEFFFPALLCSTAMMVSFFESTYGNFTKLTHQKTYATILMTRMTPDEIVGGELLWGATKGMFGVIGVTVVAGMFGLLSKHIIVALPVLFLVCFLFSCLGMVATSFARNYDSFIYSTSGFIVPMSLLSGTYFPLDELPKTLQYIAYLLPLTHAVSAVRSILTGNYSYVVALHVLIMILAAWLLMNLSFERIRSKLLK